jgi:serine/threonine protein kinase
MDEKAIVKTNVTFVQVNSSPETNLTISQANSEIETDLTIVQVDSLPETGFSNTQVNSLPETDFTLDPVDNSLEAIGNIGPNFEILSILGEGATGIVYRARHLLLDKIVAIKVLKEEFTTKSKVFLRFQQEARTTSHLSHENIAMVHDFGLTESGHPFIVMDYIEGLTLAGLIDERIKMPEEEAISIFQQISKALIHAHEHNVIHRDLKPSNIILQKTTSGEWLVKVVDFGIAKVIVEEENNTSPKLTKTGEIFGTPLYMSPEQCQGMQVDHRSDIYSLGCLMYESLIGAPPFTGASTFATLLAHVSQAPAPFHDTKKDTAISDALERIVFRCLEKEPEDRYQSIRDLLKDLDSLNKTGASSFSSSIVAASKLYSAPRKVKTKKMLSFATLSIIGMSAIAGGILMTPHMMTSFAPLFQGLYDRDNYPWSEEFKQANQQSSLDAINAEIHYDKAITIAQKNMATPEQIADIKYQLGVMLFSNHTSQHKAYEQLDYTARHEPQNSLRHANTLEYLSRLGNHEAEQKEREAEKARLNDDDHHTADKLLAQAMELKKLAREQVEQAVALKIKILNSKEHSYVQDAFRSKGQVMYKQGLYAESETAYLEALTIARKLNLHNGATEAARLYDLANCCRAERKLDQAKSYYQQSLKK